MIDGNGQRVLVPPNLELRNLFEFESGTTTAGIYDLKINSNGSVRSQIINVREGSKNIYIYENLFVDTPVNEREDEVLYEDRDVATANRSGVTAINLQSSVNGVFIDSNVFSFVPNGIRATGEDMNRVRIYHNLFAHWRIRAIFFRGKEVAGHEVRPNKNITIANNRILPPKYGNTRQPITFQSGNLASDHTFDDHQHPANEVPRIALHAHSFPATFMNVRIEGNYISGDDVPHRREPTTDRAGNRVPPDEDGDIITDTLRTNGTSDMISIHNVSEFSINNNCLINSGELGIAVSNGSEMGVVRRNHIENADTSGIGLGASPHNIKGTSNIDVSYNHIINPGRNRNNESSRWPFAGIVIIKAEDTEHGGNSISENTETHTVSLGISITNFVPDEEVSQIAPNIFDLDAVVGEPIGTASDAPGP